jgi:Fungal protein of unknown function (DUF1748)
MACDSESAVLVDMTSVACMRHVQPRHLAESISTRWVYRNHPIIVGVTYIDKCVNATGPLVGGSRESHRTYRPCGPVSPTWAKQNLVSEANDPVTVRFALRGFVQPFQAFHLSNHGTWKACPLCLRCNPFVYRRSWRQAFYRFCVRVISFSVGLPSSLSPPSFPCSPDTETISNPTIRSLTEQYLGFGEMVFNTLQGTVVSSPYFKRSERP